MIPEKVRVEELSREDLQAMVLQLMNRVRELEEQLRVKRTPSNSKNSSQPPSRDFKSDKTKKRRRRRGAKAGHARQERELVEKPDKVIYALAENCASCQANLLDQVPLKIIRRQIMELPEIRPLVIETQQYEVICPVAAKPKADDCRRGWKLGVTLVRGWKRL